MLHERGDLLLVVADGAGGRGGGGAAAEQLVAGVRSRARELFAGSLPAEQLLLELDDALYLDREAGETTAVIALVTGGAVSGASAGDSGAWLLSKEERLDLTRAQVRKPMLGSGRASPRAFGPAGLKGQRLLLASDGLLKYASPTSIQELAVTSSLRDAPRALIELVRLPSGALQDDIAVIVAEG